MKQIARPEAPPAATLPAPRASEHASVAADTGRRRRPSGEPPPLPRKLYRTGKYWMALGIAMFVVWLLVMFVEPVGDLITHGDVAILKWVEGLRASLLTSVMKRVQYLGSPWTIASLRWGALLLLLVFRRFRHFFVYLGSILFVGFVCTSVMYLLPRERPLGIDIIGHWQGPSNPSRPIAALTVTLMGIAYALVVPGRPRTLAKWITAACVFTLGAARLYLGVDYLTDVVFGVIAGVAVPLVAFRLLTPNDVFPVSYRRGSAAHLDVSGPRGQAIRTALEQQLGITVLSMKPFGLAGSGGSTPLLLKVAGDPETQLFAKLYAATHLRADRWYKLGRTLLYGRLEDERAFNTVRRLVQYEDYLYLVMRDAGVSTPQSYGVVEITPEREYVLVISFLENCKELVEAEVDDRVIDDGLLIIRKLWDGGLAHRDIKPSNLLVDPAGRMHLIDVAFGEVRPSPWRQAVDLANMMIVLALRCSPEQVYERALKFFTPEEIAEAFAATHTVTMPSQSRNLIRKDHRDLVAKFRALAPKRKPISIQRWSARRIALTVGVLVGAIVLSQFIVGNLPGAGLVPQVQASEAVRSPTWMPPECNRITSNSIVLEAQSVPTARLLPCVSSLPLGWNVGGMGVRDGRSFFYLESDTLGPQAVEVTLERSCDYRGATRIPTQHPGVRSYQRVGRDPGSAGERFNVFQGGCASYSFNFGNEGRASLAQQISLGLGFYPLQRLLDLARRAGFET